MPWSITSLIDARRESVVDISLNDSIQNDYAGGAMSRFLFCSISLRQRRRTIGRIPCSLTRGRRRIIEIEKEGLVLMSEALEAVGDTYSINGFTPKAGAT